jgi:hypothetical protein
MLFWRGISSWEREKWECEKKKEGREEKEKIELYILK